MNRNEHSIGVIWTRVSSKKQMDEGGSLEHQIDVCRSYAQRCNIEVIKEYGGFYESAKVQGKHFKQMIAEVKRNRHIKYLIIYSSDRFGRNGAESIKTSEELRALGIYVIAATQEIDARTPQGKFMRNFNFIAAEFDNDVRREKCTAGVKAKVEAGIWCGKTPLGYYSQGKGRHTQFIINEQGWLLKKAFELKMQGVKNCKILEWLSNRGVEISKQQLHKIFVNPFYAGKISHKALGDAVIDGNQPPLITWSEFERVQLALSARTGRYVHDRESPKFPLLKHVFCAEDHTAFTKYTTKNINYYKCNVAGCCTNRNAKDMHRKYAELLDGFALPKTLRPIFEKVVKDFFAQSCKEQVKNRTLLTKQLSEITNNIRKVQMNRAIDAIDDEIYQGAIAELTEKKLKVERELEKENIKLSNFAHHIHKVVLTCCELGDMWRNGTLDICQQIQHLAFPEGVEWDKSVQNYRTPTTNEALSIMRKFSDDYINKNEDKTAKNAICPQMCG